MRVSVFLLLILPCQFLAGQPLSMQVVDLHGLPVPGARVEIRTPEKSVTVFASGAGEAQAAVSLPAVLRASAPGFDPAVQRLEHPSPATVVLQLLPAAVATTIEVVVREEFAPMDPGSGTVLEIDPGAVRTVFDAVDKLVPGAFVTRRGVMGYGIATNGTGGVSIRGVGGQPNTGVLVVIDGRPDFMGLMGHPLPDFYRLSEVESISVTQGPASVLYGSNAMGGVVEIKPSLPREGTDTRLFTSLGSFLTGQHRLSHGSAAGRGFYAIHAGIDHTSGDRDSAAFRSKDASAAFGYDLSRSWKASLKGRYGHFHVEDPGPEHAPLANSFARVGRGGFSLNLDNSYSRSWGYARLYSSHGRHIITDGFRSVDRTTGGRVLQSFALSPDVVLDAGSDIVHYGGRARNVLTGIDFGEHTIVSAAGFSRVQWAPARRLRLNAGLRHDQNSVHGGVTAPEFGATFRLSENYTTGAAVARGFRNPTLRELYLFPAPNPLLKPEHLWNYQATFQARPHRDVQASITAYYASLDNLIVTTGRFPNLELSNSGRALNRGLEGRARWRPVRRVRLESGYAWLRSTNLAPFVPAHKWSSSVEIDADRAYFHLGTAVVGKRWASLARTHQLGGYTDTTLRCTVPIQPGYSVFVMVDNLLNQRYEVIPGYPMPGTNLQGGLSLRF